MSSDSFDSEGKSFSSKDEDTESKTNPEEPKKTTTKDLINSISLILTMVLEENKHFNNYKEILKKQSKLIFTAKSIPKISINDYLLRIQKYSNIENSTFIIALIYIDRICNYNNIQLNYRNIFKLILASTLVAIKFNEDVHYSLEVYAKIGGVQPSEMENLEFHFLILIKFALNVDKKLYDKYSQTLLSFQDDDDYDEYDECEEEREKDDDKSM